MNLLRDNISNFESLGSTLIMAIEARMPPNTPSLPPSPLGLSTGLRVSHRLTLGALGLVLATNGMWAKPVEPVTQRLYINYSARPDPQDLTTFDFCILDAAAEADLAPGHTLGHTYLAYVSTVEARPGSTTEKLAISRKVPFVGKNSDWGTHLLDITHAEWLPMLVNGVAKPALDKGFDGFFLDTIDSAEMLTKQSPEKAKAYEKALVGLIRKLHSRFPTAKIVINRGFGLLDEVATDINGVLVESVFQTFDPKTKSYKAVAPEGSAWLESRIRQVQMRRLPVYAVDYVDPAQKDLAKQTADRLSALGCIPFVTTQELNGTALAPLSEVPRRVLVLYGWNPKIADKPATSPSDTLTAMGLGASLKWLGFDAEYLNVGENKIPDPLPARFAGVIMDEQLTLPPEKEKSVANWLLRLKDNNIPILFAGDVAIANDEVKAELATALGISGTMKAVHGITNTAFAKLDGTVIKTATQSPPSALGFQDITAPAHSDVFLSLRGEDKSGNRRRFDSVFLAPWGGLLLEPSFALQTSNDRKLPQINAIRFLGQWLKSAAPFPAPDTTTRDGRRLFYSNIEGNGFAAPSHFPGHPSCAEVIRSRILRQYTLPVTVALDEADKNPESGESDPLESQRRENIARSILTSANVQAGASHKDAKQKVSGSDVLSSALPFSRFAEDAAASDHTSQQRRSEPVHLHYDFQSAANPASQIALEKAHDWCSIQPFHPITALQYSQLTSDAVGTKFHQVARNHWLISNSGQLRTFRIPSAAGIPDLERCQGISGYKTEGDVTYIHTTGRLLTDLVLVDPAAAAPDPLHLVESSADVTFHELTAQRALFEVGGWTTVDIVFAGIPPGTMVAIRKNKESGQLQADSFGTLRLSLPPRSTVALSFPRTPYAASR